MEKQTAYAHLAKWFEYLNDDCDYANWSQYLIVKLSAYSCAVGVDIGCGGGWFTRAFQKHGYQMTGVDISAEMLDFAQETAMKQGVRSEYILGDISKMKLPGSWLLRQSPDLLLRKMSLAPLQSATLLPIFLISTSLQWLRVAKTQLRLPLVSAVLRRSHSFCSISSPLLALRLSVL